jgi:hypothetical protein
MSDACLRQPSRWAQFRRTMELTVRIGRPMWFSFLVSFLVLLIVIFMWRSVARL